MPRTRGRHQSESGHETGTAARDGVRALLDALSLRGERAEIVGRFVPETGGGVFLTGATGFLGMELLARFLERTDRRVYALVRAADERQARARIQQTLLDLFGPAHPYADRVVALRGDITHVHMGMTASVDGLADRISEIVHCAAAVSFEMPLEHARVINVDGTRRVLEFAERCHARRALRRMSYISTAYVAGDHRGYFSEDDLDHQNRFRNSYEQSKFEAECLVRRARRSLPITVFRPSIIVGERESGWTATFNVLYWPLRTFARGTYIALPGRPEAAVDVVPVDYVADAVFALSQMRQTEGATFHLTASPQASSVGRLIELATTFFRRRVPWLVEPAVYRRVVHPFLVQSASDERARRALRRSEVFFPYFDMQLQFDNRLARVALRDTGLDAPPLETYFDRLVHFALAAEWGARRITRATALGQTGPPSARARAAEHTHPEATVHAREPELVK
jgi:thioester reductase-like protein